MEAINIRTYQKKDIQGFYEAVVDSIAEVSLWLPWCNDQYSLADSENWIKELVPQIWFAEKGCEFIIENTVSKKIVGACCLEQLNLKNKEASIAYWIRSSETGKGLATHACRFLLEYGFRKLGLEKIKIIPSVENEASKRVAEKMPHEEKILVENGFQIRDKISDALVFVVTKQSYENSRH